MPTIAANMDMPVGASPPTSPGFSSMHHQRPSTASMATNRAKRSLSRFTDGHTSRSSDDDSSRTAVRVAVRVRPALKPSDPGFDLIPARFRDATCDVPTNNSLSVQSPQGKKLFVFDRVFGERSSQDDVWGYLNDSVTSFVKGYNVSILAYGQSGSGKSYTMGTSGPADQSDAKIMGVVPRAARTLFDMLNGPNAKRQSGIQAPKRYSTQGLPNPSTFGKPPGLDKSWSLKATYVEIYQEQLRDLLVEDSVPPQDRPQVAIREDAKGRILVTGLTQVAVNSVDDLLNALNFGSTIRQTDSTNINARSSRSHAIFSLNLVQKKTESVTTSKLEKRRSTPVDLSAETTVTTDSKLHFVDLAGSERLKNTGATGDRAKEGISINAGLASLGKVISQLSTKGANAHISYRDSRLTRMLQDSLGGNAITFMVACVTPAGFHLSETLNTVHYAQRARAIQSKPEIQQSHEEGDKQAAIDRLRAEVSFLRDQIRHTDNSQASGTNNRERNERLRARETEMQQQLMDMQENYNALSGRHARLISELSKARAAESAEAPEDADGAIANDRIKRSSSFAQAVEQMVLEYEKTIQTLESSLSNTRGTLSTSESTLLEKETRIAYMETVQQQLQARIQKAIDREQSNDSYLQDLEQRMEGTTDGEEKSMTLIEELRKELSRVRESESNAEEYISTLEERLADAEQDQDVMQREIDRLEHVVERQRSIGRLDNLLGELDGFRPFDDDEDDDDDDDIVAPMAPPPAPAVQLPKQFQPKSNGHRESYDPFRPPSAHSSGSRTRDGSFEDPELAPGHRQATSNGVVSTDAARGFDTIQEHHATTQNDFMADKVENLTNELVDLRSEHETVMVDYDKLQQKYQTALETLARMDYEKEHQKMTAPSNGAAGPFLADAGMSGESQDEDGQPSSSPSWSEELRSRQQRNSSLRDLEQKTSDPTAVKTVEDGAADIRLPAEGEGQVVEVEVLKRLNTENEAAMAELASEYEDLQARHETTLVQIEELKSEIQRTQNWRPASQLGKGLLRRKSDDILGGVDARVARSLASLRNVADNSLEDDMDARQAFEINLNTVMTELQGRSERVHALEAEISTVKKELDAKQTIISGLTRERSSLKASSNVDFSVVGQMQEQLLESENQIRALHEQHESREGELQQQIDSLKDSLVSALSQQERKGLPETPGAFPPTPSRETSRDIDMEATARKDRSISQLQDELVEWEKKHNDAVSTMKRSESRLLQTITGLEESLRKAEVSRNISLPTPTSPPQSPTAAASLSGIEDERKRHKEVVDALQREVDQYKSTANKHLAKLQRLEASYQNIATKVDEESKTNDLSSQELKTHRDLVANLESQLEVHKSTIALHQQSLETLQASHSEELDGLKVSAAVAEERHINLLQSHEQTTRKLQSQLTSLRSERAELLQNASIALGHDTDVMRLHSHIKELVEEGKDLQSRHSKTTKELREVSEELQNALHNTVDLENRIGELKTINDESLKNLQKAADKEKKSSRLVEKLEEQLNNNFDSHRATNNRLSSMQDEVAQQRLELERELEDQKLRNSQLESQLAQLQRSSVNSNQSLNYNRESLSPEAAAYALARSGSSSSSPARKSTAGGGGGSGSGGGAALPVPPPAIPLPPLPTSPTATGNPMASFMDNRGASPVPRATSPPQSASPPTSRHTSKDVGATTNVLNQQIEEQESRIRTIEKHLFAEKQLTATLEEALVDLETSANRTKSEMETYRKKCTGLEDELVSLKKEKTNSRASLQAVEEEREMRVRAERARQALEQRMMELNASQKSKKKKNALNCF